jgi:multidrug efflux system outer membrane protein
LTPVPRISARFPIFFNLVYKGGTTTYLEVLDGQRSLFSAELTLAQARGTEYQSLVQLYRSLGGGWQE